MNSNKAYNKLLELAPEEKTISVNEFLDLLRDETSRNKRMNVMWRTADESVNGEPLNAHVATYFLYWDDSAYGGGDAGGSATKKQNGQYNLQISPGEWRTLNTKDIISVLFRGKKYKVN